MDVTCASCGGTFEAKRSTAKYCGPTCRTKGNRAAPAPAEPATTAEYPPLVASVRAELTKANRLHTPAGQQAIVLAWQMLHPMNTGSAVASASKQLTEVLAIALDGATVAADPLEEMQKAWREQRTRRAG